MPYGILPHTADLRAVLTAPDWESLAQAAVDFVRSVVAGDSPVVARETRVVAVEGEAAVEGVDEGERFFRFVRELFYLFDVDGFLPLSVEGTGPWAVSGEVFDPDRHAWEHHVKALTRHAYVFERGEDGYRVDLVVDL